MQEQPTRITDVANESILLGSLKEMGVGIFSNEMIDLNLVR